MKHFVVILGVVFAIVCAASPASSQDAIALRPGEPNRTTPEIGEGHEDQVRSAVIEARRHLEMALTSDETHIRFPAYREVRDLREPWIAEIVLPGCDSPDLIERNLALEAITSSNPPVGREAYLHALDSGERSIRLRGLLGLEKLSDPRTIPNIARIMTQDHDPDLRAVAARVLGAIGDTSASVSLFEALESDIPPVREQAVLSLMVIDLPGLREHLLKRLAENENPGELNLLRMLALIPDTSLVPMIEPYLSHEVELVRTSAAVAIFKILERSGSANP